MPPPSPDQIADIVLGRRQVYGLDADSRLREAANRLTARAFFELLTRMDAGSPDFAAHLSMLLHEFPGQGASYMIGFDTSDRLPAAEQPEAVESTGSSEAPSEHYLRLVFREEDAAYYQFHLFPDLTADYIRGASRKRAGAVQHLHLELSRAEALQDFIESCRSNPHFLRVEESTEEEFCRAPSHGI